MMNPLIRIARSMENRPAKRRERTELYAEILEVVKRYHGRARVTGSPMPSGCRSTGSKGRSSA